MCDADNNVIYAKYRILRRFIAGSYCRNSVEKFERGMYMRGYISNVNSIFNI